jgi:hypothetical protein
MIDELALSNPKPTWYSSVPTIHNATVSYMRDMAATSDKLKSYGVNENRIWKVGHSLRMTRSGAAALSGPDAINLTNALGGSRQQISSHSFGSREANLFLLLVLFSLFMVVRLC